MRRDVVALDTPEGTLYTVHFERQTPYNLTYKWNLINKTNKRAKWNQRHGNKEQTDSDQRGWE